jgi:hypothetical protein
MSATANSIYQLVKSYEGKFTPPAPYFVLNVGTLNVDTGVFTGLSTQSETDPEPLEHRPGATPTNPPPHFVGETWVSVTIDSRWRQTTTITPAPHVPLQPVQLVFSISRPVSQGWSVSVSGETVQAGPGQTSVNVNIWDATIANWTMRVGTISHTDSLRIQRPAGVLGGALGGFTIPVLPVTIVYAPPADSLNQSTATYTQGQTVGQTSTLETTTDTSRTVPTTFADTGAFAQFLGYVAGKLNAAAAAAAATNPITAGLAAILEEVNIFSTAAAQVGQASATETTGITDLSSVQMTVTTTTSTALGTGANAGGPGVGDAFYFFHDLRVAWAYYGGRLMLCPLGYKNAFFPARALQGNLPTIGVSAGDAASLLALDPFVSGGPNAALPTDRFQPRGTWEYGFGLPAHLTETVTRDTNIQSSHATYTTDTNEWEAGPILKFFGLGEKNETKVRISNATGKDVSSTITIDASLASGPNDYFVVNLWYDSLFGTFAFQLDKPATTARLRGQGAQPNQEVKLQVGGKVFTTVADQHGNFAFFAPSIPSGRAMLRIGDAPGRAVEVGA